MESKKVKINSLLRESLKSIREGLSDEAESAMIDDNAEVLKKLANGKYKLFADGGYFGSFYVGEYGSIEDTFKRMKSRSWPRDNYEKQQFMAIVVTPEGLSYKIHISDTNSPEGIMSNIPQKDPDVKMLQKCLRDDTWDKYKRLNYNSNIVA